MKFLEPQHIIYKVQMSDIMCAKFKETTVIKHPIM